MATEIVKNNHKITIKNIKVKHSFNNNIFVAVPFPDSSIDLGTQGGIVECINFKTNENLEIGDVISIKDIDFNDIRNRIVNKRLEINGNFGGINVEQKTSLSEKDINQIKVLSWILDGEFRFGVGCQVARSGMEKIYFLHIQGDEVIEVIDKNEVTYPDEVRNALINYIREHPQDFQLGNWKHVDKIEGMNNPWWQYDREIKSKINKYLTIHLAFFGSETQYQQVYNLVVDNLNVAEYNRMDDENESLDYLRQNQINYIQQDTGLTQQEVIRQFGNWINESVRQPLSHVRNPRRRIPGWEKELHGSQNFGEPRIIIDIDERLIQEVRRYNNYWVDRNNNSWKRALAEFYSYQQLFQNSPLWEKVEKLLLESLDKAGTTANSPMQHIIIPQNLSELQGFNEHCEQVERINDAINSQRQRIWKLIKKIYDEFEKDFQKWQEEQEQQKEKDFTEDNSETKENNPHDDLISPTDDDQNESEDENSAEKETEKSPQAFSRPKDKDWNNLLSPKDQTDEINANTPLPEVKKLTQQKIEQLLEKHTLKTEKLPSEYQNWQETVQKLESAQLVINFLKQMQKVIAQQAQNTNQQVKHFSPSPKSEKNLPIFLLGLGMIIAGGGGLITLLISHFSKKIEK